MIISRPGATWGGFFVPSRPSNASALVPILTSSFPPLVRRPTASRRHFCARASRAGERPKRKTAVKAICRPVTASCALVAMLIFPRRQAAHSGPQKAQHGINQPRPAPLWSKPGYFHSFRAMDSTAQRSFSASLQAQRDPLHKGGLRAIRGGHPFAISISARISV